MSKLSKFLGTPQEFEIQGEKTLIHPLKVKDLELFEGKENASGEEKTKLAGEIMRKSLQDDTITNKEVEEMSADAFSQIMDAISKLNGLTDERVERIRQYKKRNI